MKMGVLLIWISSVCSAAPELLSQAGLYADIKNKTLVVEVQSYTPRFALWSDGLEKSRWARVPSEIDKTDPDAWVFPVGTQLWKEFRSGNKRVETRLMQKVGEARWEFVTYLWNDDETEAKLAPTDGVLSHYPLTPSVSHDIPSQGQCKYCHQRFGDPVLGFSAVQLSTHPLPGHSPLEQDMLGYLHANCASCHHPEGRAGFTENFYHLRFADKTPEETATYTTSVDIPTVNFPIPDVETTYRLRKGHPEQSALVYRLTLDGPQHMPSLGTKIPDEANIEGLRRWVLEMK